MTPTPEASEREHLLNQLVQFRDCDGDSAALDKYVHAAIDEAFAAVRAALVAEMVAGVEKGREQHDAENCDSCDCGRGCPTLATNSTIDWAIALIRSTATTETEK
jgi:hypothetical protein